MAQTHEPLHITPAQDAELDRLADQGFTYRDARRNLGIVPVDHEVMVVEVPTPSSVQIPERDEIRERAEKLARQLGGHPDDHDPRYR